VIETEVTQSFILFTDTIVFIEGHRGCLYEAENTFEAFQKAFDLGCESVEFDVKYLFYL